MPISLINEKDLNQYLTDIVYHGQEMEVFTKGEFHSHGYVRQNKDAIVRSMLLQWCKHRLRSHLMEDLPEHQQFLTPVRADEPELPEWAERCLAENKPIYRFEIDKIPAKLTENIGKIRDYLYSAAESYVNKTLERTEQSDSRPRLRIDYLKSSNEWDTFSKTLHMAEKWHELMAKKAEHKEHNSEMYKASLSGTVSVMKLKDGMEIVQLTTPEALDYESEYMGHCVGKGGYDADIKKGTIKIYSLRDSNGEPHATFEVHINKETGKEEVLQCKGKGNKAPVERYRSYVQEFVKAKDFVIKGDTKNIGLIQLYDEETKQSQYYDTYNLHLPKNKKFVCKGDLDLSDMKLTELPDLSQVIVKGNFDCSDNQLTSLEGAPQEVGGDFNCYGIQLNSLEGAPQQVGGAFQCFGCHLISLQGAPQKVGGSFNCDNNQLTSLQGAPQQVGGAFLCCNNQLTSLQGAPQKIGGYFSCMTNQLTSLQGGPQQVGDAFICSENQLTSLEGAPLRVGTYFICYDNPLTSLMECPKCESIGADNALLQKYGACDRKISYEDLLKSPEYVQEKLKKVRETHAKAPLSDDTEPIINDAFAKESINDKWEILSQNKQEKSY